MTATDTTPATAYPGQSWFSRAEDWLDARGKLAWIGAIIIGFVAVWPVGLALLAYVLFFKKGGLRGACANRRRNIGFSAMTGSTGNRAFDAYKADTLRRLEEEQANFEAFLGRLRDAKDKAEFDQFMSDRTRKTDHTSDQGTEDAATPAN